MAVQTLKLAGKKFVVVEEGEYRALQKRAKAAGGSSRRISAEDRYDVLHAKRAMKEKGFVTLEEVKRRAGI